MSGLCYDCFIEVNAVEDALDILKGQIKENRIGRLYVFHGPESFLREHYLRQIRQKLVSPELEGFDLETLNGSGLDFPALRDAVECVPMSGGRRVVIVSDYALFALNAETSGHMAGLIEDLPESVCLVFHYDTLAYKADGRSKLTQAVKKYGLIVEFALQKEDQLIRWAHRHFAAEGKEIGREELSKLIFLCGADMHNLRNEIGKLACGVGGASVTKDDIDKFVIPTAEAGVFALTNAIAAGRQKKAAQILRDLTVSGAEPPVKILSVVTRQMLNLYAARLLLENKKGGQALQTMCGMNSSYQAKITLEAARTRRLPWFRRALGFCFDADITLKGGAGRERALELLLGRLFAYEE
ncbi:MAG: DNA polymerase III subunit delta [Oscillospiraceae bacterium]|jgi:DNA polymerase-3 subunit delta|nr:DNA polymerase III subunit delta [Oscillospiraceae bacterium]